LSETISSLSSKLMAEVGKIFRRPCTCRGSGRCRSRRRWHISAARTAVFDEGGLALIQAMLNSSAVLRDTSGRTGRRRCTCPCRCNGILFDLDGEVPTSPETSTTSDRVSRLIFRCGDLDQFGRDDSHGAVVGGKVLSSWDMTPPMPALFSTMWTKYPEFARSSVACMPAMPPRQPVPIRWLS